MHELLTYKRLRGLREKLLIIVLNKKKKKEDCVWVVTMAFKFCLSKIIKGGDIPLFFFPNSNRRP